MGLPSGRDIFYPLHKDETFINKFDLAHESEVKDRESRLMSVQYGNRGNTDINHDILSLEMTEDMQ